MRESPLDNMNLANFETSAANCDALGSWYGFGKKIGYTAICGQGIIVRPMS